MRAPRRLLPGLPAEVGASKGPHRLPWMMRTPAAAWRLLGRAGVRDGLTGELHGNGCEVVALAASLRSERDVLEYAERVVRGPSGCGGANGLAI